MSQSKEKTMRQLINRWARTFVSCAKVSMIPKILQLSRE
jgi:hypothetical protein